jgi:hypothetical protein
LAAILVFREEQRPKAHHGLKYVAGSSILQDRAKLQAGFFTQFLAVQQADPSTPASISLEESLLRVPELFTSLTPAQVPRVGVVPFTVSVKTSGKVTLTLDARCFPAGDTAESQVESGQIVVDSMFQVGDTPYELVASVGEGPGADGRAGDLIESFAWPPLNPSSLNVWFLPRSSTSWPRAAYYFSALFLLCSAVRYNPAELDMLSAGTAELGWQLERFLDAAERYVPQLALTWYFGGLVVVDRV